MKALNLSTRIVMFAICSSLEYDLKKFILGNSSNGKINDVMWGKAKSRNPKLDRNDFACILEQLDLGDFVSLIVNSPYEFQINNYKGQELSKYFDKIIPVRNRVMHTKPLELGDRAILMEIIQNIDREINWVNWEETSNTREILENDPSQLISAKYYKVNEYNPSVYNNLPEPEFDDTGYVGRKKEIVEIKELLNNNKNQIITIVGNGGIGKTATAVKTLYELTDDENCKFEAIIWISLKTKTLSKGEFVTIKESIESIPQMLKEGEKNIIADENLNPKENLLKFMEYFKVLLILDNLETVNNSEINSFLKEIPEGSKILITSRHGVGELEYRFVLHGMSSNDSIIYFRELSKYFGLSLHKKPDIEIKQIVNQQLYSNPLSIKWFISGIFNGLDENTLLANKDRLIEFCMSNVFNKLSENSKKVLQLFLIENKELALGEIDFFLEIDEVSIRQTINELLSTNMINLIKGKYSVNDMARDYLSIYHAPSNDFIIAMLRKRKTLNAMLQDIRIYKENDPFNPKSLFANMEDDNKKLSSYYLSKALDAGIYHNWEEAFGFISKAASISPDYFEVYKIKAFLSAERNELFEAINNYQIALSKCERNIEKASVLYLFSVFYVIKLLEFELALKLIKEAEELIPDETVIQLEKSRILMYLGKYEEAELILCNLEVKHHEMNSKIANIFASRYADLFRRRSGNFGGRDADKKVKLLKEGISKIEMLNDIDTKTYLIMIKLLKELAFLYFNEEAMELLAETLEKHFSKLESIKHRDHRAMKDILISHKNEIPNALYSKLKKFISDFKLEANHIYEEDQGIIVYIRGHFGFIANAHDSSIYFNSNNIVDDASYGDRVKFEVYNNYKGKAAKNIKKV